MSTDADIWTPGGEQGPPGPPGPQGPEGPNIELRTTDTHVQWRVEGDITWINLIALSELVGPQGSVGATGPRGDQGEAGNNIELQTTATHIQWRVVGGATWTNLVALVDLEGEPGASSTILRGDGPPDNALDGVDGDYYIQEDEPDFGVVLYGPKTSGTWPINFVPLSGPQGDPGSQVVLNGSGAPVDSLGFNGDFYIDTDVYDLYGPKSGGTWGTPVSLIGPAANFLELTDTPAAYTGHGHKHLVVNGAEGGLEFTRAQYGELNITQNTTAISFTAAADSTLYSNADYIQITGIWDAVPHGVSEGVTQQANSITIGKAGVYKIKIWMNFQAAANKTRVGVKFAVNGVIGLGRRPTGLVNAAAETAQLAAHGLHQFSAGDVLTLYAASTATTNVTFEDCVFSVNLMQAN